MAHGRRHRKRKPPRRKPWREAKPLILCVCEGQATEPQYLKAFGRWCRNPRVTVKVSSTHGVPDTLVRCARESKREATEEPKRAGDDNLRYDEVWCVFD
ncbi:MAG: RloB domain-containing protein, partial [Deltaproteobacteria bacterium]|nr:RloB domain-containing protein [Deltaproteobacteria bacterium]